MHPDESALVMGEIRALFLTASVTPLIQLLNPKYTGKLEA